MEQELNHLVVVFKKNGYKENQIDKAMIKARGINIINVHQDKRVSFPYIKGLFVKLARILKESDIHVSFFPIKTIRNMIDWQKIRSTHVCTKEFMQFLSHVAKFILAR